MGITQSNSSTDPKTRARELRQKALQDLEERVLSTHTDHDNLDFCNNIRSTSELGYQNTEIPKQRETPPQHFHENVSIEEFDFPFENLIFEGGGNKGLAYIGCIRCLEELGLMSKIKRLAGTSAGAISATFLSLGYESQEVKKFLEENMNDLLFDNSWGYLSLIPNLLRSFGWNPGSVIYQWFGDKIKMKSADRNPDMTFKDLYKERGIELCIVVTNVNRKKEEYCHVKTTPDMPIRKALRMTIGIPGIFSAIFYDGHGQMDAYVDGGVLCNYPIHAFDGWYLSMSPEDAFLEKIASLDNMADIMLKRFDKVNEKTLGFLLYSEDEEELLRDCLEKRQGPSNSTSEPSPPTKLLRERRKKMKIVPKVKTEYERIVEVGHRFMNMLKKFNLLDKEIISKTELARALEDKDLFSEEDFVLLFGTGVDVEKVFSILDQDGNGMISSIELMQFVETLGMRIQSLHERYKRLEVNSLLQFSSTLLNTILMNSTSIFVKQSDASRTVGINTGYIDTLDFVLEEADVDFVIQRGYEATQNFLKYYVSQKNVDRRRNSQEPKTLSSDAEELEKHSNTNHPVVQ